MFLVNECLFKYLYKIVFLHQPKLKEFYILTIIIHNIFNVHYYIQTDVSNTQIIEDEFTTCTYDMNYLYIIINRE